MDEKNWDRHIVSKCLLVIWPSHNFTKHHNSTNDGLLFTFSFSIESETNPYCKIVHDHFKHDANWEIWKKCAFTFIYSSSFLYFIDINDSCTLFFMAQRAQMLVKNPDYDNILVNFKQAQTFIRLMIYFHTAFIAALFSYIADFVICQRIGPKYL